jgi:hypothetical protein
VSGKQTEVNSKGFVMRLSMVIVLGLGIGFPLFANSVELVRCTDPAGQYSYLRKGNCPSPTDIQTSVQPVAANPKPPVENPPAPAVMAQPRNDAVNDDDDQRRVLHFRRRR